MRQLTQRPTTVECRDDKWCALSERSFFDHRLKREKFGELKRNDAM